MAHPDLRLGSGRPIVIDTSNVTSVADARREIASVLKLPLAFVRLVTSAGLEPIDDEHVNSISTNVTIIVIDIEAPFLQACRVWSDLGALFGSLTSVPLPPCHPPKLEIG